MCIRVGGQVVIERALYSDDLISSPAEVYNLYCVKIIKMIEKEVGNGPFNKCLTCRGSKTA